jgi:hypothetical protein
MHITYIKLLIIHKQRPSCMFQPSNVTAIETPRKGIYEMNTQILHVQYCKYITATISIIIEIWIFKLAWCCNILDQNSQIYNYSQCVQLCVCVCVCVYKYIILKFWIQKNQVRVSCTDKSCVGGWYVFITFPHRAICVYDDTHTRIYIYIYIWSHKHDTQNA